MVEEVEVEEMKEVLGGEEEGNSYNISEGKSAGGMGRTVGGPPSCPGSAAGLTLACPCSASDLASSPCCNELPSRSSARTHTRTHTHTDTHRYTQRDTNRH